MHPGIAVLLLAITIYLIPIRWIETRNFTPLDIPVAVSDGRIRTGDFKTNLGETYFVRFDDSRNSTHAGCGQDAWLNTRWTVFRNGQPLVVNHDDSYQPVSVGPVVGQRFDTFNANRGTYSLVVDVLPGAECLNVARVRLSVGTDESEYLEALGLLRTLLVFLMGTGIAMLIRFALESARERFETERHDHLHIFQSHGYRYQFTPRKLRPTPVFFRVADFGLIFFTAIFPAVIALMILTSPAGRMGVSARLVTPSRFKINLDPAVKPLLVWLDAHGNYFLKDKPVAHDNLENALEHELAQRADHTVYFEGDCQAEIGDAIIAMNKIGLAGGKLIWLTPKNQIRICRAISQPGARTRPPVTAALILLTDYQDSATLTLEKNCLPAPTCAVFLFCAALRPT